MRHKRKDYPLRVELLKAALYMYMENGFTLTTNQMIANKVGCSTGQITNFFHSKENILYEIVEQVLPFHQGTLGESSAKDATPVEQYSLEIAMEISICERMENIRDLYINTYTLPKTFELVREYSYEKSVNLFSERLPHWSRQDFFETEALAMGLVYGALMDRCNPRYSLSQKLTRMLDALLKIYEYSEQERKETIDKILSLDVESLAESAEQAIRAKVLQSIEKDDGEKGKESA